MFSFHHVFTDTVCLRFDTLGFRDAMTMAFTIDEINNNSNLLPNVTLGYTLYDTCGALIIGLSAALSLTSGQEELILQESCLGTPPVLGIVGDSYSTISIAISHVLGLYKMPIVSFLSSMSYIVVFLCSTLELIILTFKYKKLTSI